MFDMKNILLHILTSIPLDLRGRDTLKKLLTVLIFHWDPLRDIIKN